MPFPSPSDYQEALQFPETSLPDPELAAGAVASGPLGLPRPVTGAFAVVFRIETATGPHALRCFLAEVPDRQARYRALARRMARGGLPDALTPFSYLPDGVRVGGTTYPALKMPWVEGEPLDAYVAARLDQPEALRALAEAWRTLLRDLAAAGVAHGDLQHGNVLVAEGEGGTPALRLVDYDAAYVPALAGRSSAEVGHRNYQHPDRTEADFGPGLDRFPGLVVYTALRALAEAPELWERFSTGENLLFQAADFFDPAASPLFKVLRGIEPVRPLAEALATACLLHPSAAPDLETVRAGGSVEGVRAAPRRARQDRDGRARGRTAAERWALPVAVIAGVGVGALAVAGAWFAAALLAVIATQIIGGVAYYGHRRLSPVRRRQRLAREAEVLRRWIADLEDERAALAAERTDLAGHAERLRAERLRELQDAALERGLRHHFVGELSEAEGVGHAAVVRLKGARVRNAFHATPERVGAVRGLTSAQREGVNRWRAALAARHAGGVPEALSPAEEQRMRRLFERRVEAFDADVVRVAAKQAVQRGELAKVEQQVAALPEISRARYVAWLLRLAALPEARAVPVEATPTPARPADPAEGPWYGPPASTG